jgi:hypothetical protein
LPVLDPLEVNELIINSAGSQQVQLNLTMTNSKILGLGASTIVASE